MVRLLKFMVASVLFSRLLADKCISHVFRLVSCTGLKLHRSPSPPISNVMLLSVSTSVLSSIMLLCPVSPSGFTSFAVIESGSVCSMLAFTCMPRIA